MRLCVGSSNRLNQWNMNSHRSDVVDVVPTMDASRAIETSAECLWPALRCPPVSCRSPSLESRRNFHLLCFSNGTQAGVAGQNGGANAHLGLVSQLKLMRVELNVVACARAWLGCEIWEITKRKKGSRQGPFPMWTKRRPLEAGEKELIKGEMTQPIQFAQGATNGQI